MNIISTIESKFYHKILFGIAKLVIKFNNCLLMVDLNFEEIIGKNGRNLNGENVSAELQSFTSA